MERQPLNLLREFWEQLANCDEPEFCILRQDPRFSAWSNGWYVVHEREKKIPDSSLLPLLEKVFGFERYSTSATNVTRSFHPLGFISLIPEYASPLLDQFIPYNHPEELPQYIIQQDLAVINYFDLPFHYLSRDPDINAMSISADQLFQKQNFSAEEMGIMYGLLGWIMCDPQKFKLNAFALGVVGPSSSGKSLLLGLCKKFFEPETVLCMPSRSSMVTHDPCAYRDKKLILAFDAISTNVIEEVSKHVSSDHCPPLLFASHRIRKRKQPDETKDATKKQRPVILFNYCHSNPSDDEFGLTLKKEYDLFYQKCALARNSISYDSLPPSTKHMNVISI